MKKIVHIGLCAFLLIFTSQSYAQAPAYHDKTMDPITVAFIEIVVVLGIVYFLVPNDAKRGSMEERKSYLSLIVFGFILLAMMVTNPSLEDHRQAVVDELTKKIADSPSVDQSDSWEKIGTAIGESLGKIVLDRAIVRENFLLFSITTINVDQTKRTLGLELSAMCGCISSWDKNGWRHRSDRVNGGSKDRGPARSRQDPK